ncbi:hypothetical protein AN958_01846, partial [Leucoagaricus sp. SymC.cos]
VCHCVDYRQAIGSAISTNFLAPRNDIGIAGPVKEFKSLATSVIFCSNCGSAITHDSSVVPDLLVPQTGNLPDFAEVKIDHECTLFFTGQRLGVKNLNDDVDVPFFRIREGSMGWSFSYIWSNLAQCYPRS